MKNKKFWVSLMAGVMAGIMILSLLLSLLPTKASAASSSEIKNQINQLESQKENLQGQINDLKNQQNNNLNEISGIVAEKNNIDQQVSLLYAQIANINEQIAAYSLLIADMQENLDAAEARLEELNDKYKERIRAMEEDGELSYWSVLFEANDFADLLDRLNMIEEIAASDRRRLKELSKAAEEVAETKAAMLEEKELLRQNKEGLAAAQAELDAKNAETQQLLATLAAKGDEYEKLLFDFERQEAEFFQQITQANKNYDEAKRQEWLAQLATATRPTTAPTTLPTVPPTTAPTIATSDNNNSGSSSGDSSGGSSGESSGPELPPPNDGSISWLVPVEYRYVSSPFGNRIHPVYGSPGFHYGVDLAGGGIAGKPIYATRDGVVTLAEYSPTSGWWVIIDHLDGFSSWYLHMTHYIVKEGDLVTQGQVIGYVGSTGTSTGPHLHFSVVYKGIHYNPMDYIG